MSFPEAGRVRSLHGHPNLAKMHCFVGFIFFGKGGELAVAHALHLLQSCLVYVNTLMLQRVLAEPGWSARMTAADVPGLTPLIWGHVNPYGVFDLDMERRLDLKAAEAA
jgi:hypothetical protein